MSRPFVFLSGPIIKGPIKKKCLRQSQNKSYRQSLIFKIMSIEVSSRT